MLRITGYATRAAVALVLVAGVVIVLSCGTEPPGTNGPSVEYFPANAGDSWSYETFNLTRDPNRQNPHYTLVTYEMVPPAGGGLAIPALVYHYSKGPNGEGFRLNQAQYWPNKDIFFKYEYINLMSDRLTQSGYHYLSEYRDPMLGLFYYDPNHNLVPQCIVKPIPCQVGTVWDVLMHNNPHPENNPTVYRNMDPKDYFGLRRDMDGDGLVDSVDISIVGRVEKQEFVDVGNGQRLAAFRLVHRNALVFHLTREGDVTDISYSRFWLAPNYGFVKMEWYDGSKYLDHVEMTLQDWWFVK